MLSPFDKTTFFRRQFDVTGLEGEPISLAIGVCIAEVDGGVFPGSRVSSPNDDLWTHGAIEAWRHWRIFNLERTKVTAPNLIQRRIFHFGTHADDAWRQILLATKADWPTTTVEMARFISYPDFFLARTICRGLWGWHQGPDDRFVY